MTFDEAQGYVVLATLAAPLLAALIILFIPGSQKMAVRWVSLIFATIMLGLSMYIFVAYQFGSSDEQIQMRLHWVWIENTAFLQKDGVSLFLGIDGISALMALLTGVVAFAGTLASWKLDFRPKDFFILFWVLVAGVYGTFFSFDLFFFFFFYELAGEPDDPPNRIYGNQSDISASLHAAQGTLIAVLHADATGQGQLVDVSAQESLSMSQETAMQNWDLQKRNRKRSGALGSLPVQLPGAGIYKAKDGYVSLFVIAPGGEDIPVLIDWMREGGMAGDLDEEPYASLLATFTMGTVTQYMMDITKATEVIPLLSHINARVIDFIATLNANDAYEEGQRRRLLVGIVSTPKNLAENTQLRARGWFRELEFEFLKAAIEFPGPPYNLSETPAVISRPPRLGEHTDEVLAALGRA
ncbi:hypothetical protein AYO38_09045 [bacterium SCGC AG-212-C10]|nr:hypothetical protein AYO38_09045 [bacterium SCGC AG-212-C10]